MEEKEIINILKGLLRDKVKESEIIEYKNSFMSPETLAKYISALSNSACLLDEKNAYVFWGIEDNTLSVVGTNVNITSKKVGNEDLLPWLYRNTSGCDFEVKEFQYEDKRIVAMILPAAKFVETRFKGSAFIRIDSTTQALDKYPDKKRLLWSKLINTSFEEEISMPSIPKEDVLQLLDYKSYYNALEKDVPNQEDDIIEMLLNEKCIVKEHKVSTLYSITNLGAMLFANDLSKFKKLKLKAIRIIRYQGINRLIANSDVSFEKGYVVSFKEILNHVKSLLPKKEVFKDGLRTVIDMYPEIILRELIPNAMMHQDFLVSGLQPRIEIFSDRIEILNSGEPLIQIRRFLDMAPKSRNEGIASLMHKMRLCEERGSGIDRVFQAIEETKLPAIIFQKENESIRVIVYAEKEWDSLTKEDKINICYQHCCYKFYMENEPMTNQSLKERLCVLDKHHSIISRIISDTKKAELIVGKEENAKKYIPYWA